MKKIKKIIALVLAGVILFGGMVMANPVTDTASFVVKTTISTKVNVKLIDGGYGDLINTWEKFVAAHIDTTDEVVGDTLDSFYVVRQVAYFANTSFKLNMSATPMVSQDPTNNTHKIHYIVKVNDEKFNTSVTSGIVEILNGSIESSFISGNKEVFVNVDSITFNGAPADTYTGTITFDITSN